MPRYALDLAAEKPLTEEQVESVKKQLIENAALLEAKGNVTFLAVGADAGGIRIVYEAEKPIEVPRPVEGTVSLFAIPLVVYAVMGVVAVVGVAITSWKTSEILTNIPWPMVISGVALLGAVGIILIVTRQASKLGGEERSAR